MELETLILKIKLKMYDCEQIYENENNKELDRIIAHSQREQFLIFIELLKKLTLPHVSNCTCGVEETTGWTEVKCCNICGKPIEGEVW